MTPAARSLNYLKKKGYRAFIVEKYNSFGKFRVDFGGFADILAYSKKSMGVLAVNATTAPNLWNHVEKYRSNENLKDWLQGGNQFHIHLWSKKGKRGKRKLWSLREYIYK